MLKTVFLEDFFRERASLIERLESGELSKKDFLRENYMYFQKKSQRPYINVNSFEKAMFNYQFYNTNGKYYSSLKAHKNCSYQKKNHYKNCMLHNYFMKDESLKQILKFVEYKNVRAYYINTNSKELYRNLFEVIIADKNKALFHSKSLDILNDLKSRGLFAEIVKNSIIDSYINERY